ncbi:MAG TPA: hypothetical protein VFU82_00230 [Gammaproteobacteria bacterium]|nr:hypothetical protein [Gammaproteobacteria bacterium]
MRCNKLFCCFIYILLFALMSSIPACAFSAQSEINVLTWWGYLDHPKLIAEAEKKCGVAISHDIYFSNEEFLRRWRGSEDDYDIIIFSETIYKTIMPYLPHINTSLWKESEDYHPVIRSHYLANHFPKNVVYFSHALTGFLWNKQLIQLSESDTASSIFEKARKHTVVIIDDPAEIRQFLEDGYNQGNFLSVNQTDKFFNHLESIKKETKMYFTNNFSEVNNGSNTAFIYAWSGDAMNLLSHDKNNNFTFLLHPKLSHITSDLLAQTSKKPGAYCVAEYLTSKKTMSVTQNLYFYFSPYANYQFVSDKNFRAAYVNFVKNLPLFPWLASVNMDTFSHLNVAWALTKIRMMKD